MEVLGFRNQLMPVVGHKFLEKLHRCSRVAVGAVPVADRNIERMTKFAKAVGRHAGEDFSARANRAKRSAQERMPRPAKFFFQKIEIKRDVVGNENGPF